MKKICITLLFSSCQFLATHPKAVEEMEDIGEKIFEHQLSQAAQNSSIHSSLESNHYCWVSFDF